MSKKIWIARDEDGILYKYETKPIKVESEGRFMLSDLLEDGCAVLLPSESHTNITFENSPVEMNADDV